MGSAKLFKIELEKDDAKRTEEAVADAGRSIYSTLRAARLKKRPHQALKQWHELPLHVQEAVTKKFQPLIEASELDWARGMPTSIRLVRIQAFEARFNMKGLFSRQSTHTGTPDSPQVARTTPGVVPRTSQPPSTSGAAAWKAKARTDMTPTAAAARPSVSPLKTPTQEAPEQRTHTPGEPAVGKKRKAKAATSPVPMQPLVPEDPIAAPDVAPVAMRKRAVSLLNSQRLLQALLKDAPPEGLSGRALTAMLSVELQSRLQRLVNGCRVMRSGPGAESSIINNLDDDETLYRYF